MNSRALTKHQHHIHEQPRIPPLTTSTMRQQRTTNVVRYFLQENYIEIQHAWSAKECFLLSQQRSRQSYFALRNRNLTSLYASLTAS